MNTITVLYDISIICSAFANKLSHTGIFRVSENLLETLAKNENIDLFCISNKFDREIAHRYLHQKMGEIRALQLLKKTEIQHQKHLLNALIKLCSQYKPYYHASELLRIITRRYSFNDIFADISSQKPQENIIFHSPFFPIPKKLNAYKNIKKIITIYDMMPILFPDYFTKKHRVLFRWIMSSIDSDTNIICISKSTRNDLLSIRKDIRQNNVFVVNPGVSDVFSIHDNNSINGVKLKYSIPLNASYLLSLCTLEPRKNLNILIKAFSRLLQQQNIKNLYLVLAGSIGWQFNKIVAEFELHKDTIDRIIITGHVPENDMPALYGGALMFVYPSLYEGFGLPLLEAMKSGLPVIASNTSSLPEVVGNSGILVNPKDEDMICQAILKLFSNKDLRAFYSRKGRERANEFTWANCVNNTIDVYTKISLT